MKAKRIQPQGINQIADSVTRQSSESEDIDLGAEATASAPAKTLEPDRRGSRAPASQKKRSRTIQPHRQ